MQYLRKNKPGHQSAWTDEELLQGFSYFYKLEGHFPTADEIDNFPYLPSSRSIQRTHGGLVNLRKRLMPTEHHDFTTGAYRSDKAREGDRRARDYEEEFYNFLNTHFHEIAIHEHKIIRPGNVASDFFIYLDDDTGIVIDLFYAQNIRRLGKSVQIKLKRYAPLPFEIYFVAVGNPAITNQQIDERMQNRSTSLPSHIKVVNEQSFKDSIVKSLKNHSKFVKS